MHTRNEIIHYSRKDIEEIMTFAAKTRLIGGMYVGSIGEPRVRWCEDGGLEVIVPHTPAC